MSRQLSAISINGDNVADYGSRGTDGTTDGTTETTQRTTDKCTMAANVVIMSGTVAVFVLALYGLNFLLRQADCIGTRPALLQNSSNLLLSLDGSLMDGLDYCTYKVDSCRDACNNREQTVTHLFGDMFGISMFGQKALWSLVDTACECMQEIAHSTNQLG